MLQFDENKNLREDISIACKDFKQLFGFSEERKRKINNLFKVAGKFKKIGCETMFVFGSFTTSKEKPNDVDVCFDVSKINIAVLEKNSSSLDRYEFARLKEYFLIHVILKKANEEYLINFLKTDRDGNQRGIIEVNLKDLPVYDKK